MEPRGLRTDLFPLRTVVPFLANIVADEDSLYDQCSVSG
jgi:hypothetical protein